MQQAAERRNIQWIARRRSCEPRFAGSAATGVDRPSSARACADASELRVARCAAYSSSGRCCCARASNIGRDRVTADQELAARAAAHDDGGSQRKESDTTGAAHGLYRFPARALFVRNTRVRAS